MISIFKSNTVDNIVAGLVFTITQLEKATEKHLNAAEDAELDIEDLKKYRDENLAEAARAASITKNVKKLLDIR